MNFWSYLSYLSMLVFDLVILATTVWLVDQRNWNPWWFLFALAVMGAPLLNGEEE